MIKIGLVGCGFIGMVHSYALKALAEASLVDGRVVSVCDREPKRAASFARAHGAEVATDVDSLIGASDAVWICTPTAQHLPLVEAAVEAGRAVFCEKPLGRDLAEAEAVAAALGRVPHQVGLVLREAPVFQALAAHLDGRHGAVMAVILRDDQYLPVAGIYGSTWRSDAAEAGSGVLLEHSIHDLDLFRFLLGPGRGEPATVACRTASFAGHPGIEDVASCEVAFDDGAVATLVSVWHQVMSRPSTRRIEVFCERAMLWADDDHLGPLHVQTSDGEEVDPGPVPAWIDDLAVPEEFQKPLAQYAAPAKKFLDALADGTAPSPDAAEALAAHRLCDAAYASATKGGAPVALTGLP